MPAASKKQTMKKATSALRVKPKSGNKKTVIKLLPKLKRVEHREATKVSENGSPYSFTTRDDESSGIERVDPASFEARILDLKLY